MPGMYEIRADNLPCRMLYFVDIHLQICLVLSTCVWGRGELVYRPPPFYRGDGGIVHGRLLVYGRCKTYSKLSQFQVINE